jgi:hypothetical protein
VISSKDRRIGAYSIGLTIGENSEKEEEVEEEHSTQTNFWLF